MALCPALRLGAGTRGAYLFVHGKLGNKEEAVDFARRAEPAGYQVVSMDLPGHGERRDSGERLVPWTAVPEIRAVYDFLKARWDHICLRANSIGRGWPWKPSRGRRWSGHCSSRR